MKKIIIIMIVVFCGWWTSMSHAQVDAATESSKQRVIYNQYYTISENQDSKERNPNSVIVFDMTTLGLSSEGLVQTAKNVILNLLKWTLHQVPRPVPNEDYVRKLHFGRWINDPNDDTCMNTRAKVLVRDSEAEVTFRNEKQCVVDSGKWLDRYSNSEYTSSREIQIDHMVPLKHAYLAGAWAWDYKTRCLYANYLGYQNHLIPSSVRENTSKGDRAPDRYLPSELSYRCQYIKDWLAIKLIWRLNMTDDEVQAIHEVMMNYNCRPGDFQVSADELKEQRQRIIDNLDYCAINRR